MDSAHKHLLSLMDGLFSAAESGGMLQQLTVEAAQIRDLLSEFRQSAERAAKLAESLPSIIPPEDRRGKGSQNARSLALPSANVGLLSPRQCEILKLIAGGRSNKQIARILGVGPETVKTHVRNVFIKLSVNNRAQAVLRAQNLGLALIDDAMFFQ